MRACGTPRCARGEPEAALNAATSRARIVRTLAPAVLALFALGAAPRSRPAAPPAFAVDTLAIVPYAGDPGTRDALAAEGCGDAERCVIGYPFVGTDGALYVADLHARHLARVAFPAGGRAVLTILDAPRGDSLPPVCDGAADRDGGIWLLGDAVTMRGRYQLFRRGPRDTTWRASARFDESSVGWMNVPGTDHPLPAGNGARIDLVADHVLLFDTNRTDHAGWLVAAGDSLLPFEQREQVPRGLPLADGTALQRGARGLELRATDGSAALLPDRYGVVAGADSLGHAWVLGSEGDTPPRLECFAADGRLLASEAITHRHAQRELEGRGAFLVRPDGVVLELVDTPHALVVLGWTLRTNAAR